MKLYYFYPDKQLQISNSATIDINNAIEEDLMTVPGINRELAKRIVTYRQSIGKFKKVEDIAPCVGAANFKRFYSEFHVTNVNNNNIGNSSKSLASNVSEYSMINAVVNINKATIFQLSKVTYITESDARKIVQYRQKKGKFKNINELVEPSKILNVQDFMKVKNQLTVSLKSRPSSYQSNSKINKALMNLSNPFSVTQNRQFDDNTYNICSWNLETFNVEKVENIDVKEVFCRTILENRVSILAVQGISSHKILENLVQELNFPSLESVKRHHNNDTSWKYYSTFQKTAYQSQTNKVDVNLGVGFVWNKNINASFTQQSYDIVLGTFKVSLYILHNVFNLYFYVFSLNDNSANVTKIILIFILGS